MADHNAARSKKDADRSDLPTRQRMTEGHRIRRKPSTDQKKVRRQMAKSAAPLHPDDDPSQGPGYTWSNQDYAASGADTPAAEQAMAEEEAAQYAQRMSEGRTEEVWTDGVGYEWVNPKTASSTCRNCDKPCSGEYCSNLCEDMDKHPAPTDDYEKFTKKTSVEIEWDRFYTRITESTSFTGATIYNVEIMPRDDNAAGYGVWEKVQSYLTRAEAEDRIGKNSRKVAMDEGSSEDPIGPASEVLEEEPMDDSAIVAARANILSGQHQAKIEAKRATDRRVMAARKTAWSIDEVRKIVDTSSMGTVDGQALDLFSASALVTVHDAVSDPAKLLSLPLAQAVDISFKVINRSRQASRKTASDFVTSWFAQVDMLAKQLEGADSVSQVIATAGDFWGGDGDDLAGVLQRSGWHIIEWNAAYHWSMQAPDGSILGYIEGDLRNYTEYGGRLASRKTSASAGEEISNELRRQIMGDPNCSHANLQAPPKGSLSNSVAQCADCGLVMSERLLNEERGQQALFAKKTAGLNDQMEFDSPVEVKADGSVERASGVYAPSVYAYEGLDGDPDIDGSGWSFASRGYTGQYGVKRDDPIMHASEYIGGQLEKDILAEPGVYVVTTVEDIDDGDSPWGWVVLRKDGSVTASKTSGMYPEYGEEVDYSPFTNEPGYYDEPADESFTMDFKCQKCGTERTVTISGAGSEVYCQGCHKRLTGNDRAASKKTAVGEYESWDVNICIDCAMLAANGEMPHEDTGNPPGWEPLDQVDAGFDVIVGDGEEFFSWSGCDTCSSTLGGNRLPATYMSRHRTGSKDMNEEEVEGLDTDQTWLENEEQWQKDASNRGHLRSAMPRTALKAHGLTPETDLFL